MKANIYISCVVIKQFSFQSEPVVYFFLIFTPAVQSKQTKFNECLTNYLKQLKINKAATNQIIATSAPRVRHKPKNFPTTVLFSIVIKSCVMNGRIDTESKTSYEFITHCNCHL